MREIAKERGGLCLSEHYVGNKIVLQWECARKHRWFAIPNSIKQGSWCLLCAFERRSKTLDDMHALARQHGGQCLSERYIDCEHKLRWRCAQGHVWEANCGPISRGHWCRRYYDNRNRGSIENMQALAASRGGKCLSETYINAKTALLWQCAAGHTWKSQPATTTYSSWCPECKTERTRLGIDKMKEVAAKHGGRCLSTAYTNTVTPMTWQCIDGHIWQATPKYIMQDHWCPVCNQILVAQRRRSKRKTARYSLPILL